MCFVSFSPELRRNNDFLKEGTRERRFLKICFLGTRVHARACARAGPCPCWFACWAWPMPMPMPVLVLALACAGARAQTKRLCCRCSDACSFSLPQLYRNQRFLTEKQMETALPPNHCFRLIFLPAGHLTMVTAESVVTSDEKNTQSEFQKIVFLIWDRASFCHQGDAPYEILYP